MKQPILTYEIKRPCMVAWPLRDSYGMYER